MDHYLKSLSDKSFGDIVSITKAAFRLECAVTKFEGWIADGTIPLTVMQESGVPYHGYIRWSDIPQHIKDGAPYCTCTVPERPEPKPVDAFISEREAEEILGCTNEELMLMLAAGLVQAWPRDRIVIPDTAAPVFVGVSTPPIRWAFLRRQVEYMKEQAS